MNIYIIKYHKHEQGCRKKMMNLFHNVYIGNEGLMWYDFK